MKRLAEHIASGVLELEEAATHVMTILLRGWKAERTIERVRRL